MPDDDVASHRLYDAEVFELSDEVSVIMVLPSTDLVCSVPGVGENVHCSRNNKFTCLPLQVFELSTCSYTHYKSMQLLYSLKLDN